MLTRRTGFYGYRSVIAGFIGFTLLGGSYYTLTVLTGIMAKDLGWSATQLGVGFAIYTLTGLAAPLYGLAIQRLGPRLTMILGALLAACGWGLMATAQSLSQYYVATLLAGPGIWMGSMLPTAQLVGNWFLRRRTSVMGLAMTGGGVGGLIFMNASQALTTATGSWRATWWVMVGLMGVAAVIEFLFIVDRPAQLGQVVDGETGLPVPKPGAAAPRSVYRTNREWTVPQALRTRTIWLIMAAMGMMTFVFAGMISYQVLYLRDEMLLAPALAAAIAGLVPTASIGGRILGGWLGARFPVRYVMSGSMALLALALLSLIFVRSIPGAVIYAVLFGPGFGSTMILVNAAYMDYYGARNFATLSGISLAVTCGLQAIAPPIIGALRDSLGTYIPGFWLLAGIIVLGFVAALMAVPPALARPEPAPSAAQAGTSGPD